MTAYAVAMLKDEADILPSFLPHLAALFEGGYLLDHRSRDGSTQLIDDFVARFPRWKEIVLDFSGQHQPRMSALFMKESFEAGAECVYFLDADEFLLNASTDSVRQASARLNAERKVGSLWWRLAIPRSVESAGFCLGDPLWVAKQTSGVCKVVVPWSVYQHSPHLQLGAGNHFASCDGQRVSTQDCGFLLHIPFRSSEQALLKAIKGCITQLAGGEPVRHHNVKWYQTLERAREGSLELATLVELLGFYGVSSHERTCRLDDFELCVPHIAVDSHVPAPATRLPGLQVLAAMLADFQFEDATAGDFTFENSTVRWRNTEVQLRSFRDARNLIRAAEAKIRQLQSRMEQLK